MSLSLHEYPTINAHYLTNEADPSDLTNLRLIKRKNHNIGVAMDTPRVLLVPVIKSCENLSIQEISDELYRLQALGKESKLGENELTDATFTISNIGSIGGTYMSPVIAKPQVAIVAIGKLVPKIKKVENDFVESTTMNFSYAADHRVVDGATVARFFEQSESFSRESSIASDRNEMSTEEVKIL